MVIITLDIHIWPDGVASVSYTFTLLDSHDNSEGGGNGGRQSRHGETEVLGEAEAAKWRSGVRVQPEVLESYCYYLLLQSVKKLGRNLLLNRESRNVKSPVLLELCNRTTGDRSCSELLSRSQGDTSPFRPSSLSALAPNTCTLPRS